MTTEQTTPRREWVALLVADPDDYRPWMDVATLTYDDDTGAAVATWAECGTCGRRWNDAASTGRTPAPSGRCPFEDEHQDDAPTDADRAELADLELVAHLGHRARYAWTGPRPHGIGRRELWGIAYDAATLAEQTDPPTVADLDRLAQRALALAVDAEHRKRTR